jgi:hypothetical protein
LIAGPLTAFSDAVSPAVYVIVFLSTLPCTIAPSSCTALAHSPQFSRALIAAMYVMAFLFSLPCTIAPKSCRAIAHSPPFSHALIPHCT